MTAIPPLVYLDWKEKKEQIDLLDSFLTQQKYFSVSHQKTTAHKTRHYVSLSIYNFSKSDFLILYLFVFANKNPTFSTYYNIDKIYYVRREVWKDKSLSVFQMIWFTIIDFQLFVLFIPSVQLQFNFQDEFLLWSSTTSSFVSVLVQYLTSLICDSNFSVSKITKFEFL